MKIGLVCSLSFSHLGGIQNHVLALGSALKKLGVGVLYISPTDPKTTQVPQPHLQIGSAINLPNFNGSWSDYTFTLASQTELKQLLQRHKLDLLHVQSPVFPFVNWRLIKASPVPVVVTVHTGWDKKSPVEQLLFFVKELAKQLMPYISKTIAVSHTAASCEKYFTNKKTVIIPNPIDLSLYETIQPRPAELSQVHCNLFFVARLDRRKGLSELLAALAILPEKVKSKLRLYVMGSGSLELEVKLYAESLGLGGQVAWLGKRSEAEKIAFLQHADMLVAPSLSGESFGMVLTEAMAAGLPIVCGNNRGYRETMASYPAPDLVVDPTHPKVLAQAIRLLSQDAQLRRELGAWGKREVKQYAVEKVAQRHLEVYQEVLAEQKKI